MGAATLGPLEVRGSRPRLPEPLYGCSLCDGALRCSDVSNHVPVVVT